jgi:hypothetical protein
VQSQNGKALRRVSTQKCSVPDARSSEIIDDIVPINRAVCKHQMCSALFKDKKPKQFHDLLFEDIFFLPFRSNTLLYDIFLSGTFQLQSYCFIIFPEIISYKALLSASVKRSTLLELAIYLLRIT